MNTGSSPRHLSYTGSFGSKSPFSFGSATRGLLGLLVLLLAPANVSAVDVTAAYLRAPKASAYLVLERQESAIGFDVDAPGRIPHVAEDQQTVLFVSEVNVVYSGFNPFSVAVKVDAEESDDPNFVQLSKFLDALKAIPATVTAGSAQSASAAKLSTATRDAKAARSAIRSGKKSDLAACTDLLAAFDRSLDAMVGLIKSDSKDVTRTPRDWPATLKAWATSSTTQANIAGARADILQAAADLDSNLEAMAKELLTLEDVAGALGSHVECGAASASDLANVVTVSVLMASNRSTKEALRDSLKAIAATLERPSNPLNWTNEVQPLYIVYKHPALNHRQLSLRVSVTPIVVAAGSAGGVTIEQKTPLQASFVAREFATLVPEVAGGLVYTDIRRPKYGTATSNGKTVVARAGEEKANLAATLLANFVCRCFGPGVVQPALQLGVSTDKEAPAILVGGALRFTWPIPFSISGGAVILSWVKDLDKLHPNDPVTGTADIESDLKLTRAPTRYYAGLQVTF